MFPHLTSKLDHKGKENIVVVRVFPLNQSLGKGSMTETKTVRAVSETGFCGAQGVRYGTHIGWHFSSVLCECFRNSKVIRWTFGVANLGKYQPRQESACPLSCAYVP